LLSLPDTDEDIALYSEKLDQHLIEYRKWLEMRELLETISAHQIRLSAWLVNSGLTPADDVDVTIEVGDPVGLLYEASSEEAKSLELPEPPTPPKRLKKRFSSIAALGRLLHAPDYSLPHLEHLWDNKATVEKQDATNTLRITFSTKRLKHNDYEHVGDFILVLRPNAIHPFQIRYRITAANITKVIEGAIPIIVTDKEKEGASMP
jgi:hypothetical protein